MTTAERAAVSAVVVTWNAATFVTEALRSLLGARPDGGLELIVVDNASADDTLAVVGRAAPGARTIANAHNRGFAAAANQGLAAATAPRVLFFNPDAVLEAGALDALVAALDTDPTLALVAPQLVDDTGRPLVSHQPFRWTGALVAAHVRALFGADPAATAVGGGAPGGRSPGVARVDWVFGACMLARREAMQAVGGFDERYFMYTEDMDLCFRLRQAGWEIGFAADARVRHGGNASGARFWQEAREAAVIRGQLRFLRTHRGRSSELSFRLLAVPFFAAKMVLSLLREARGRGTERADARRCLLMVRTLVGLDPGRAPVPR